MAVGGKVIKGGENAVAIEPAQERVERAPMRPARQAVLTSDVVEAKLNSADIIAQANRQKEEILAEAGRQREALFEEAKEQGRQEGLAQVTEQIARAKIQAGEILQQNEPSVIGLACKLAEKIIGREVDKDAQALVELCATAVENVRSARAVVLRLNPAFAAVLRERKKDLVDLIGRSVDLAIKEDPDILESGCMIQTEFGTIDARVTTQLQILQRVLLEEGSDKDGPP
jgi:type III secretion protein L